MIRTFASIAAAALLLTSQVMTEARGARGGGVGARFVAAPNVGAQYLAAQLRVFDLGPAWAVVP
jgi:hypothetical protein